MKIDNDPISNYYFSRGRGRYGEKQIGWELERTAMGDGFHGNALRVAKDFHFLTADDRAMLDKWATGRQEGTDHVALQEIAMKIYFSAEPDPQMSLPFDEPENLAGLT